MTTAGFPGDAASGSLATNGGYQRSTRQAILEGLPPLSTRAAGNDEPAGQGAGGILRTIKRRQSVFLFTFIVVTGALALNALRERIFSPVYQGSFQLQVSNPFEGSLRGGVGFIGQTAQRETKTDIPSLIILMKSPLVVGPVALKQGVSYGDISRRLGINKVGSVEDVLNVNLRWSDPAKGRAILSDLSKAYVEFSKNEKLEAIASGVKFLDQQAPEIETRMTTIQNELRNFREKYKYLNPSSIAGSIQSTRDGMLAQMRSLQMAQVQLETQIASVESGKLEYNQSGAPAAIEQMQPGGVLTEARGSDLGAVAGTPLDQLQQYEQQLANARATFKESSPIITSIKAKRDQLKPVVQSQQLDALKSQLFTNLTQQDELNRQIMLLNKNFVPSLRVIEDYDALQGRLALARENYQSYIKTRERFRLEQARSTTPWQVIAPPSFGDVPIEPNLQRNFLRAIIIGLLAGVGAAILREKTDNVFHTPMDAERELQLPVLGLIPHLPLEPGIEISSSISKMSASERFAVKESLRSLFTTFKLLRADRNIRLVGVTSSTQGEGKSTSVTVFARTLADLGLKVLVVDADMRLPMQTRYLGVEQGEGVSSLLSNRDKSAQELITSIQDNLDVIPAGPKPPDPAKLLNSIRCQELIDEIRDLPDYDIVLFDAPPCLMLADPILLGEKLDGILFLVGLGKVSRDLAPQACTRIKATGVDVLGLICNQVNFPTRLNDYGYEYGYYYHYAYAGQYGKRYGRYGNYGARKGYGRYNRSYSGGISNYFQRRYKDTSSYFRRNRYTDTYMSKGTAVKGYHDAAVESMTNTENTSQNTRSQQQGYLPQSAEPKPQKSGNRSIFSRITRLFRKN